MKLRDLSPAILTSFFLLFIPAAWTSHRDDVSKMREVDARIVSAQEYPCPSGGRRRGTRAHCWELMLEYKAADGTVRRKIDYSNLKRQVGEWTSVLINDEEPGGYADGTTTDEARGGALFYTFLATGMFATGCYASLQRVRARRTRELASAQTT